MLQAISTINVSNPTNQKSLKIGSER